MNCPRCNTEIPDDAVRCPRCQNLLRSPTSTPATRYPTSTPRYATPAAPAPAPAAGPYRLSILGYREWYLIHSKINVRIDGVLVGTLRHGERMEMTLDKEVVEVSVAYLGFGKEWRTNTTLVRLDPRTCLQIKTSRFSGKCWVEKLHELI